ncbi:MAG: TonB-dependent hemoglobin/transferrin/lactoferrin family receptor [Rhodoferax sp.]|nr:TonB-dependent hemoglobin/transferrin/lactoferrin family receptor [Rhodoferax sp.]
MHFVSPRPPCRLKTLPLLVGLACLSSALAQAQSASVLPEASNPSGAVVVAMLPGVVISGSRNERYIDDLALSMDVFGAREMEEAQMGDIRDVAKGLPNVSVKHAPARFSVTGRGNPVGADGNAGFSIRGQGGNRVTMLVDGIRLPRSYINGSNAFGRDAVSLGLLKRIEFVRGPTSVLYGSDGLAGLVNFITSEPADFLTSTSKTTKTLGGKAWLGYSGDDQGTTLGGTLAGRASDTVEWLLTATSSRSGATDNMGTNDSANVDRTTPNPQTNRDQSVLGKLVLRPNQDQRHYLTIEHVNKDGSFELLSSRAKPPYTGSAAQVAAAIVDETSVKSMARNRFTWDARYQLGATLADSLQTVLSWQETSAQDDGQTVRKDGGVRIRKTSYQERAVQLTLQAEKTLRLSPQWSQTLTYGIDHTSTDLSNLADGSDPAPLPAFLPRKYFPDTRDSSDAIYVQSELATGDWRITPGIRYDRFALKVLSQTGYSPNLSATPGRSLSGSAVSPKLGVLFRATPQWSVYGNYASGFRAPEGQQVNSTLEVSTARLLPNPELKPEKSRHIEIGVRARMDQLTFDAAAFTGRYTNLIVEKKDLGTANGLAASVTNPTLFQTVNVDKASISGFEFKGQVAWGQFAGAKLSTPFGYGQTRGRNDVTGQALTYIEPAKLGIGLKMETASLDLRLDVTHQTRKDASDIESRFIPKSTTQLQFLIPAATTLDLRGQWRFNKTMRLNIAALNLTDKKYWNWSDVQGLASNPTPPLLPVVDAYTQAGRHFSASLVAEF